MGLLAPLQNCDTLCLRNISTSPGQGPCPTLCEMALPEKPEASETEQRVSERKEQHSRPLSTRAGLGRGGPHGMGMGHGAVPDSRGPGFESMVYVGQSYIRGELPVPGGIQEWTTFESQRCSSSPQGGHTSVSCLLPSTCLEASG